MKLTESVLKEAGLVAYEYIDGTDAVVRVPGVKGATGTFATITFRATEASTTYCLSPNCRCYSDDEDLILTLGLSTGEVSKEFVNSAFNRQELQDKRLSLQGDACSFEVEFSVGPESTLDGNHRRVSITVFGVNGINGARKSDFGYQINYILVESVELNSSVVITDQ